jgi:hypothetical protein
MKSTIRILLLSTFLAFPSLAVAEGVSETNARAVEAKLLSLMAKDLADAGALSVKAAGDRYDVLFDLRKALEKTIEPWTVKEANSILHALRPVSTGRWEYSGQGEIRLSTDLAAANRSSSVTLNIGSFENKGIFDENLRFIRNGEFTSNELKFGTRSGQDSLRIAARDYRVKLAFAEEKTGLGDISTDVAAHEISETFGTFPNPETRLEGETLAGRFLFEDVDFNGIARLVDFWGGSAKGKTIDALSDAERAALSDIIATHAPFVRRLGENTSVDGASLRWAGNALKIQNLSYRWAIDDLGGDAAVDVGAKVTNLSLDADALPPALKKALPKEAALGLRYSGFKLSAMWQALADPKMVRESLTTKDYYTKRILPEGVITASFDGTYVRSEHYDVTLSGGMALPLDNPGKPEKVDLKVTARDFDKTIRFLQDLSKENPQFSQMSFTAMAIKGFGKVQADGSVLWHIKTDAQGALTVNGQPLPRG